MTKIKIWKDKKSKLGLSYSEKMPIISDYVIHVFWLITIGGNASVLYKENKDREKTKVSLSYRNTLTKRELF